MADAKPPRRPSTGAQQRADRTRALVIDETVKCIVEEGFGAASANHVAERAGVTWGVIQYHFGDRNGLFMSVVDDATDRIFGALERLPQEFADLNEEDRIERLITTLWEAYSSPISLAALEILVATRQLRDEAATRHLVERGINLDRLSIRVGADLDGRHASAIATFLQVSLRGLAVAQMLVPEIGDTSRERRNLARVIGNYLRHAT